MQFDLVEHQGKFVMLLYGLVAFVVVVGGMLLLLDAVPAWFARRREAQLVAASASGAPLPRRPRRSEGLFALFFLLPTVLLLLIGLVVPAIRTTVLSFMDGGSTEFVGLRNYGWMFSEDSIVRVLLNTLAWVILVPLLASSIGLLYAVMVDRVRFEAAAKSLIFMPMAISFVGASIIWRFVYAYRGAEQEQIGLLNQIVVTLGGEPRQWLLDSPLNTLLLIVIMVWIQAGFAMVVLSAAIKAIPADIVEAARLDGVTPWQMFRQITLPSIKPALIVVVVTISIATLKVFDIVRTSTNGNYDTSVVANEMYNQAFRYGQNGQGSALAVMLFVLVIPIVIYQIRNLRQQREG
ncbi:MULTISPECIES: carbohydrate ABC transporter permease [Micromonospora]|uniref:Carbohydrate ABC transporter membrane protein 1, CUT1 family n=1 Tax=Micromonospora yangpuensis TaxID=683228 RepID=A0A1C6V6C8_9ACTN|nr:sugar ABC transporter permease [Micromonospora yangpuensis]GGM19058.1 alpha-glucoside ABC transporter permease [Micromonospora yangpuensis]SCL61845.1 carbohydrate ABC transporter membrane protein 1, CUT1 family [Micromonospora yangpuensis]